MTVLLPDGMTVFEFVGLLGVVVYVCAYAALQLGFIRGNGYWYPSLIISAACCMLFSLYKDFNIASATIQLFFIGISLVGLTRRFLLNHRIRFSEEEAALVGTRLADLPRASARRLFDAGHWITAPRGTVITHQDEPVTNLVYLHDGTVDVRVDGETIGQCARDSFVGEVTALSGSPATATAIVRDHAVLFSISAERLRIMAARDRELGAALQTAFSADMRSKLTASNQTIARRRAPATAA